MISKKHFKRVSESSYQIYFYINNSFYFWHFLVVVLENDNNKFRRFPTIPSIEKDDIYLYILSINLSITHQFKIRLVVRNYNSVRLRNA